MDCFSLRVLFLGRRQCLGCVCIWICKSVVVAIQRLTLCGWRVCVYANRQFLWRFVVLLANYVMYIDLNYVLFSFCCAGRAQPKQHQRNSKKTNLHDTAQ